MTPSPSKSFNLDDLVFAKVKGYPHWPARITEVKTPGKLYSVVFFGTKEVGNIKSTELWGYYSCKDKFITEKTLKNPLLLKGVVEIRQAAGDSDVDSTPVAVESSAKTPKRKSQTPKQSPGSKKRKPDVECSPPSKVDSTTPSRGVKTPQSASPKSRKGNFSETYEELADELTFMKKTLKLYDSLDNCDGSTDFTKCFELFEDLLEIHFTKKLLLKNSDAFQRIYHLQHVRPKLNLPAEEQISIQENIRKASAKATFLFNKCCKVFKFSSQAKSWEEYLLELKAFN